MLLQTGDAVAVGLDRIIALARGLLVKQKLKLIEPAGDFLQIDNHVVELNPHPGETVPKPLLTFPAGGLVGFKIGLELGQPVIGIHCLTLQESNPILPGRTAKEYHKAEEGKYRNLFHGKYLFTVAGPDEPAKSRTRQILHVKIWSSERIA